MSRCFPYPPPGYLLPMRREEKGPLIESIKLQKDKEKAKEERRKERKREKKDKKRKRETHLDDGKKLNIEKSQKLEKELLSLKGGNKYIQIHGDDESSDVTEEHNQPVCVPKPSYSSENSQNSDKRRKHESTAPNSIKADGSILKIRLASFKKKEPNAVVKDDVGPSISGRRDDPIVQTDLRFGQKFAKEELRSASKSTAIRVPSSTPLEQQPSLKLVDTGIRVPSSTPIEIQPGLKVLDSQILTHDVTASKPSTSKPSKSISKSSKAELLYKSLLESWAPPSLEGNDDEDQDWLFQKKSQKIERSETSSNVPCSLDSNLWPRAQFLPSVNVYALPYTVPF